MAEDLDDGEFWLPSQFLTEEEDTLTDISTTGFSSPGGDSVTETESDEDEFFAELTRRISRSSLLHEPKDGLVLSRSPQSTLFPVGGSSRGSPTGPVSPPAAKEGCFKTEETLNAAAGEVAKLRMKTEQHQLRGTGYFDSSRGFQFPAPIKQPLRPPFHGFFPHHHHRQQQIHLPNRPLGLSPAAWPPLQRTLNRPTPAPAPVKRETVGTGVFLPRRIEVNPNPTPTPTPTPTESRKMKPRNDSNGRIRGQGNIHGQRRYSAEIRLPSEWTY